MPAPHEALELTLSTSLVEGLGQRTNTANHHVSETVDSGTSFLLGLGYRASAPWTLGVTTAYEPYDKGPADSSGMRTEGAVLRVGATYHFNPNSRMNSWLQGGTGYRWLREGDADGNRHDFHGFELVSVMTGSALRVSPRLALGPALGTGLDALLWDGSHPTAIQHLSLFWYLGLQARVDFSGDPSF